LHSLHLTRVLVWYSVRVPHMYDPKSPASQRVIAKLEQPGTWWRLVQLAFWSTKDASRAEDLVADTLIRVMDPDDLPWIEKERPFLSHMSFSFRHVWNDQLRRHSAQEVPEDGLAVDDKTLSKEPPVDEELDRRRMLATFDELGEKLLAAAGEIDATTKACMELAMQGLSPEEQAAKLGCDISKVYEAQHFRRRHAARLRDEWNASELERMRALRDRAKRKVKA
jgi:DNA-directed RNA polymerase specialized sigma24 family protein